MSLATRISDLATRVATECKSLRTLLNGNAADLSALTTTDKASLVAALNSLKTEVDQAAQSGGASINDTGTSTSSVWSSSKAASEISAAVAALVNGAPGVLDTLEELATALGNDANFGATITASLGNRVRVDAAQSLTAPQQKQARDNIDAVSKAEIGDPETNFVTTFNTGLN